MNVLTSRIQLVETDHPVLFNLEMTKLLSDADPDFPFATALALKNNGYDANGIMGDWRHLLHGHHYRFHHMKTGQSIEVPLSFGPEFGVLDPCFLFPGPGSDTARPLN